ncbi:hypothetical protein CDV31_004008 [Fusarium ambrosium]|uniref:Heterokaryon incompatibility domain-containing protein n=1 Tax=Fusarium ambrosium TaxID=131363 RepID=A0A428US47_9HYPO|nr:hypothetical protein CDV31_004008 [Fusarium ambrosium]
MGKLRAKRSPPAVSSSTVKKRAKKASPFQYEALDPRKQEIRLLELYPGKPGSKVITRLFNVSLDERPSFEALSYTWGPPRPTYDIVVNGTMFSVGRNLRKALDDLRHASEPRVIWTDAICINQPDNAEKEHQIKLMQTIYATAQVVCAWLDHNVQPITSVFEDLENLGKGVELDDFHDPSYWYPVADIFRNPYWRRLWIQQELILAPKIQVYCRRDSFDGAQLLQFQDKVGVIKREMVQFTGPLSELSRYIDGSTKTSTTPEILGGGILRARESLLKGRQVHSEQGLERFKITRDILGSSLLHLFLQASGLKMTEPRDRVYGVLGLVADIDQDAVWVDYQAPVVKIYSQVFSLFLDKYHDLSFLAFEGNHTPNTTPDREGLPTWMPHVTINWGPINASRACGTTRATHASVNQETLTLSAEGLLIDTVSFIGEQEEAGGQPILEWLQKLEGYCRRVWPDAAESPLYEKEDVTALLFSWLGEQRYRAMYHQDKPTPARRVSLLRALCVAAAKVEQQEFSVRHVVFGGYTPTNVLSRDERAALIAMLHISYVTFVGTSGGRLGTIDKDSGVKSGDQVWILFGCRIPVILRPVTDKTSRFTVVGYGIFPGLMRGEAIKEVEEDTSMKLQGTLVEIE